MRTAIDAYSKPLPDDNRTPTQRRADALVELARQVLNSGDAPSSGGERPHLNVHVPLATLERRAGAQGPSSTGVGSSAARPLAGSPAMQG